MRLLHAACELAAICEGGITVRGAGKEVDDVGQKNTSPEKIKDIEMALKDISTIYSGAFWRDKCRRLLSDRQALMKENQRLREELEQAQAEMAVWKDWRDKLQVRTIELYEREKKLVEALRKIYRRTLDPNKPCRGDVALIAHDTLKELGLDG
jgi:hypothetical protein